MKTRLSKDEEAASRELVAHINKTYRATGRLRRIAFDIYREALPRLERGQIGFYKPITASHARIAQIVGCHPNTVGPSLRALFELDLIDYSVGERGAGSDRAASVMRRRSIQELKGGAVPAPIEPVIWDKARLLADKLSRPLVYENKTLKPKWEPNRIGRIHCNMIQCTPRRQQVAAYRSAIPAGHLLVRLDIEQAEPTVIKYLMKKEGLAIPAWPPDPYQEIATCMSIPRDEAKQKLIAKHYVAKSTMAAKADFGPYGSRLCHYIQYARELDELKGKIRVRAKCNKPPYSVLTLGGRTIHNLAGKTRWPHNGRLLARIAQGTIADAIVPASLQIIELEDVKGWRLLSNMHDGFYMSVPDEGLADEAKLLLEGYARKLLPLNTKMEIW